MRYLIEPMLDEARDDEDREESIYQQLLRDSSIHPRRATQA